jgi:hypothetical protein
MSEYIFDVASKLGKIDWPGALQRSDAFPLDRSSVFSSLEDAELYISGLPNDSRGLGATAYAGQFISVYDVTRKQIIPYFVQLKLDASGEIIGRELKELLVESNLNHYCIDGGNAEQAEAEALENK